MRIGNDAPLSRLHRESQKVSDNMTILVTGGAGFIGSNFVHQWLAQSLEPVVNLDKLTYAASVQSFASLAEDGRYTLVPGDIADARLVSEILVRHHPRAIVNFAAESHVDRSIAGPAEFIQTNILGTFELLETVRVYWATLSENERSAFRFLHVSTDEVFGSLGEVDRGFTEQTPYAPNSPYAASKAASDHLVRAYHRTFGLPVLTTNCSNNYGPMQHPEKFIPTVIQSAITGRPIPVYGDGRNVRDWVYVEDHCLAIRRVLESGRVGESYNIGGTCEVRNIEVATAICALLSEMRPASQPMAYAKLLSYVPDRLGHDFRYAVDSSKISQTLGWCPTETFESGLRKTVRWYLDNQDWVAAAQARTPPR